MNTGKGAVQPEALGTCLGCIEWVVPFCFSLYSDTLAVPPYLCCMDVGWWLSRCIGFCKSWHLISCCSGPQVQMCSQLL